VISVTIMAKWTMHCIVSMICVVAMVQGEDAHELAGDNVAAVADRLCAQYPKLCAEIASRHSASASDEVNAEKRASFVRLGKRASFVRLGKRASFVRLGKRYSPDSAADVDEQPDAVEADKRASFVRLGKRASFVRLG